MKYTDKTISGQGNTVYRFWLGKEEMTILHEILEDIINKMPKITQTQILRHRLITIRKELSSVIRREKTRRES